VKAEISGNGGEISASTESVISEEWTVGISVASGGDMPPACAFSAPCGQYRAQNNASRSIAQANSGVGSRSGGNAWLRQRNVTAWYNANIVGSICFQRRKGAARAITPGEMAPSPPHHAQRGRKRRHRQ